jgi:hypothetical protein
MDGSPVDLSTFRQTRQASEALQPAIPARNVPANVAPGSDGVSTPPAESRELRPLSRKEQADKALRDAHQAFAAFQAAKLDGGDADALQRSAINAAEKSAKFWHALKDDTLHSLSSHEVSKLYASVLDADHLVEQAEETAFGLALTAMDAIDRAHVDANAAKTEVDGLRAMEAPDSPPLKAAEATAQRKIENLNTVLQKAVSGWQAARDEAKHANAGGKNGSRVKSCEFWLGQAEFLQKALTENANN